MRCCTHTHMHTCMNLAVRVHRMGAKADRRPDVAWRWVVLGWVGLCDLGDADDGRATGVACGWMGDMNCPLAGQ